MFDRSEYKMPGLLKNHSFNVLLYSLRFIFLFCLFPSLSFSSVNAIDTTKQKYELNDPQNPDCPCHKYQKLAEEEFKKTHPDEKKPEIINPDRIDNGIVNNNLTASKKEQGVTSNISISNHEKRSFYKKQILQKNKTINRLKFKLFCRNKKIKRIHTDYSVCFKW